jgi:hypothetical protein
MSDSPTITVTFTYDNTRGIYEGQVNGGQRFLFSGHRDAPMPKNLTNALESLRLLSMKLAEARRAARGGDELPLEDILEKIKEFEARGGTVQRVGRQPKAVVPKLTLEDLDL